MYDIEPYSIHKDRLVWSISRARWKQRRAATDCLYIVPSVLASHCIRDKEYYKDQYKDVLFCYALNSLISTNNMLNRKQEEMFGFR